MTAALVPERSQPSISARKPATLIETPPQISGLGSRLQELYRQAFGTVFHGSPNALVHAKRYSLEPLREGPSSLVCDPNGRIQLARLRSLKLKLETGHHVTTSQGNVFSGILILNPSLWQTATFLEARIDLKIANRRTMVPVILNPAHDKVSGIHLDDAVESWLIEHHFANHSHEGFVLARAHSTTPTWGCRRPRRRPREAPRGRRRR